MGAARDQRVNGALSLPLAGLQAGMAAALWMLGWLGIASAWRQSSFWTAENLWASTFYGPSAIHSGFSTSTFSGLALYLLVYSIFGGIFAAVVRFNLPRLRLALLSIVVAAAWYYLSFHVIWHTLNPLVWLLHAEQPTLLGHVLYGTVLARFPSYLPPLPAPPVEAVPVPVVAGPEPEPEPAPAPQMPEP